MHCCMTILGIRYLHSKDLRFSHTAEIDKAFVQGFGYNEGSIGDSSDSFVAFLVESQYCTHRCLLQNFKPIFDIDMLFADGNEDEASFDASGLPMYTWEGVCLHFHAKGFLSQCNVEVALSC